MSIYSETGWINDNNTGRLFKGTKVFVKNNDVNKALRKFKKRLQDEGWFNELREREFYEKPTTQRKRAKGAAKARLKKKLQKEALPKKR